MEINANVPPVNVGKNIVFPVTCVTWMDLTIIFAQVLNLNKKRTSNRTTTEQVGIHSSANIRWGTWERTFESRANDRGEILKSLSAVLGAQIPNSWDLKSANVWNTHLALFGEWKSFLFCQPHDSNATCPGYSIVELLKVISLFMSSMTGKFDIQRAYVRGKIFPCHGSNWQE